MGLWYSVNPSLLPFLPFSSRENWSSKRGSPRAGHAGARTNTWWPEPHCRAFSSVSPCASSPINVWAELGGCSESHPPSCHLSHSQGHTVTLHELLDRKDPRREKNVLLEMISPACVIVHKHCDTTSQAGSGWKNAVIVLPESCCDWDWKSGVNPQVSF